MVWVPGLLSLLFLPGLRRYRLFAVVWIVLFVIFVTQNGKPYYQAGVYHDLTSEEQSRCVIFGRNYGQAGTIDYYGEEFGLPGAVSGHNSYWFWGPGETDARVIIIIGGDYEDHAPDCEECEECVEAARIEHEWARWFEANQPVWVCRGFRHDIEEIWPEVRSFN